MIGRRAGLVTALLRGTPALIRASLVRLPAGATIVLAACHLARTSALTGLSLLSGLTILIHVLVLSLEH